MAAMIAKPMPPSRAAWVRPWSTGAPNRIAGSVNTGSASRVAKVNRLAAVSAEAARPPATVPDETSIPYCSAAPAAPPPGTTRANALPAIWEESTGPSRCACRQMSCTTAMQTRLPAWSRIIGTNQVGSSAVSRGAVEKTSIRLGASR